MVRNGILLLRKNQHFGTLWSFKSGKYGGNAEYPKLSARQSIVLGYALERQYPLTKRLFNEFVPEINLDKNSTFTV